MAVIAQPFRRYAPPGNRLGRLCLRYVNWCAGRRHHRSLTMRLTPEAWGEWDAVPSESGLTFDDMGRSGGIRALLRLYNRAYVGAPDYSRAGWVHAMALQASNGYDPSLIWIARYEGWPVGFCMARLAEGRGRITGLGVLPEVRRRGFGTKLLQHAIGELERRGAETVSLHVCEVNLPSIRIYERLGFRSI